MEAKRSLALDHFIAIVLDPEREDAHKRLSDKSYWGDTGYWVVVAIGYIEGAIHRVPFTPTTDVSVWLEGVIEEITHAQEQFRREEEDPDGYGSATFNGALGRVYGVLEAHREG
jgi:hypothetical protein